MEDKNKNERLGLLKELIKLAKADEEIREVEFDFLYIIAQQMGISKDEFLNLFEQYIAFHPPKLEHERILQFQRLILVMSVDKINNPEELDYIRQLGIRMGLQPAATEHILTIMGNYPNNVIPPEKLIEIFKTHHN